MTVKLLTDPHLRFLSLTGGCRGSSESTLVKMPHCWKPRVAAHLLLFFNSVTASFLSNIGSSDKSSVLLAEGA